MLSRPRSARRAPRRATLLALLASFPLASCGDSGRGPRPNVVFISIDSLRADHLSCYGYDRETSPAIDALARAGARFETVVAESSWTLPTHMTMLTGLTSAVHGVTHDGRRLADGRATLAEVLRDRGYRTRGLWSGTYLHPIFGFGQGFEPGDYEGLIGELVFDRQRLDPEDPRFAERRFADMQTAITAVTSPAIVDKAVEFLEARGASRGGEDEAPFFLFLHLFDVHFDYNPPESDWRTFDPDYDGDLDASNFPFNEAIHPGMDPRDLRHLLALYDGEIRFVDRHLGRLFTALDRLGFADDTYVVVVADHGDEFFEHGDKGHQKTLFDEVILVPWIIRGPGIEAGRVIPHQVRHIDLMPTVLGLTGSAAPEGLMGDDLAPVLRGDRAGRDLSAVSHLETPRVPTTTSLRTPGWKLITRAGGEVASRVALYDLRDDPGEERPLQDAGRVRTALDRLRAWSAIEQRVRAAMDDESGAVELPEELRKQLDELGY